MGIRSQSGDSNRSDPGRDLGSQTGVRRRPFVRPPRLAFASFAGSSVEVKGRRCLRLSADLDCDPGEERCTSPPLGRRARWLGSPKVRVKREPRVDVESGTSVPLARPRGRPGVPGVPSDGVKRVVYALRFVLKRIPRIAGIFRASFSEGLLGLSSLSRSPVPGPRSQNRVFKPAAAKVSRAPPTRLETRTKESCSHASRRSD